MDEWTAPFLEMKSGQKEAVERPCDMMVGKDGRTYLWADADHIYVTAYRNPNDCGEGFGGAILRIPLKAGGTFTLRGGWKTNSGDLYKQTGVDLRNHHLTRGCVAQRFEYRNHASCPTMIGVLYLDTGWTEGDFDRIQHIAQQFANDRGERVHFYAESQGGARHAWCDPKKGV